MKFDFESEQLEKIRDQAMIYQCACPAQICSTIHSVRGLFNLQNECMNASETDRAVHERIQAACEQIHQELEKCLHDILKLEGWDMNTLKMPDYLQKRMLDR